MAAEVMHHYHHSGAGGGDAWAVDRKPPPSPTPSSDQLYYRTTSPIVGVKEVPSSNRLVRPKSGPPSLLRSKSAQQEHRTKPRPKTAVASVPYGCDRVNQLEREPTRKHNLDSHLPQRKPRSPPWQKNLDVMQMNYGPPQSQPVPVMITPAYTLNKSKTKIEMHIKTDEFFEPCVPENARLRREDPERDSLISQLQQQIDDLTLFLEEERLNHRETKRRAADQLRDKLDDLGNQHENYVRQLQQKHEEETESLRTKYQDLITQNQERSTAQITKMKKEIEYLQSAFESYKSQLHFETDERWKAKEDELRAQCEEDLDKKIDKLRQKLQMEKSAERAHFEREQKYELQNQKREHKREMDSLTRRFANHQADIEKLNAAEKEVETLQKHLVDLQEDYDSVCSKLTDITRDLTDTKVKLLGYEEHFEEKCQEIDEKYKSQIEELKQTNIELRRLYVKKCGQLFDEKSISERAIHDQVESAKDTMKYIIETRNRALVSVAASDPVLEKRYGQKQKYRPLSAPATKSESQMARISAGATDDYVQKNEEHRRPKTAKSRILRQIEKEIEDGTLVVERSEVPENVEDILLQAI